MSPRRSSSSRRRPPPTPCSPSTVVEENELQPAPPATVEALKETTTRHFGKATLALALLLGTVVERVFGSTFSSSIIDIFHLVVAIGIALLIARSYRNFMRRALAQSRNKRGRH